MTPRITLQNPDAALKSQWPGRMSCALQSLLGLGLLVAVWHAVAADVDNDVLLPKPLDVLTVLGEQILSPRFHRDVVSSLRRVMGGYC